MNDIPGIDLLENSPSGLIHDVDGIILRPSLLFFCVYFFNLMFLFRAVGSSEKEREK